MAEFEIDESAMTGISRRSFVKGSVAAAGLAGASAIVTGAFAGTAGAAESAAATFESTVEWDDEYDVIVVGFGGAGAATAITASDAGAKVLVLEKAPKEEAGGNTRVSGGWYFYISDAQKTAESLRDAQGGFDDGGGIDTFAKNGATLNDWYVSLGADADLMAGFEFYEWPEFMNEGYAMGTLKGGDGDAAVWSLLKGAVEQRSDSITVWYEAPCTGLVQDKATGIVHGCEVEVADLSLKVRACRGVVLSCGGFENNPAMQQDYLNMVCVYPIGTTYNTGDGVKLALSAGADLWHMANYAGSEINFVDPDTGRAVGQELTCSDPTWGGGTSGFAQEAMIVVGSDGKRFRAEDLTSNHGKVDVHGAYTYLPMPDAMWCIFDETARTGRPIYNTWSDGNEDEISKGWIVSGDTLAELAESIELDSTALQDTVDTYNGYCTQGVDEEFGRAAECLVPLQTPPYYAMRVYPTMYNTMGGARRNGQCQIIGTDGDPIPHLYGAGEFGSCFGKLDSSGYGMTECAATGIEAGKNAAETKDDVDSASVMEGKEPTYAPAAEDATSVELGQGEYLGSAEGIGGTLTVKVTMDGQAVGSVEVVEESETEGVGSKAIDKMPAEFAGLTIDEIDSVDTVAGATTTSNALIAAVRDAMEQAQ